VVNANNQQYHYDQGVYYVQVDNGYKAVPAPVGAKVTTQSWRARNDNDGKFGQLGRPLSVERAAKKISCRSTFDAWLWRVMGIRLGRRFRSRTAHPMQRHTSSF